MSDNEEPGIMTRSQRSRWIKWKKGSKSRKRRASDSDQPARKRPRKNSRSKSRRDSGSGSEYSYTDSASTYESYSVHDTDEEDDKPDEIDINKPMPVIHMSIERLEPGEIQESDKTPKPKKQLPPRKSRDKAVERLGNMIILGPAATEEDIQRLLFDAEDMANQENTEHAENTGKSGDCCTPRDNSGDIVRYPPPKKLDPYLATLPVAERKELMDAEKRLQEVSDDKVPLKYRILRSNIDDKTKAHILQQIVHFEEMNPFSSEHGKMKKWMKGLEKMPFGTYLETPVGPQSDKAEVEKYLSEKYVQMDEEVFGQETAKTQILQIVAGWIANPDSTGNILGLCGPPGVGKTSLSLALAHILGRPFHLISLGGMRDVSVLEGHHYTYEGAVWGMIAEALMKSGCMNPVFLFDEVDKVDEHKRAVMGYLTHLTDETQNHKIRDSYFAGIELDLSKCLFIFSYNDRKKIDPILMDRITEIEMGGYNVAEKLVIGRHYLMPKLERNAGLAEQDVSIPDDVFMHIINKYTNGEEGVRSMKRALRTICMKLNLFRFIAPAQIGGFGNAKYEVPIVLTIEMVEILLLDYNVGNDPKQMPPGLETTMYS